MPDLVSLAMEEISLTSSTGTAVSVGIDILICNGSNFNAMTILASFR